MDLSKTKTDIPWLITNQMIEVDRAMIEDYQITLTQMMENAGRNLAHLARLRFLNGDPRGKRVTILAGTGGNGGGAMVCARRLHNYGATVSVFATKPDNEFEGVPAHQLKILRNMSIPVGLPSSLADVPNHNPNLVIDGCIGYSLKGNPYGGAQKLIEWANTQPSPVLALDMPSGVDGSSGNVYDPSIRADATLTLALPKDGLRSAGAIKAVGELYLGDISVPPELYANKTLDLSVGAIFAENDIVRLS